MKKTETHLKSLQMLWDALAEHDGESREPAFGTARCFW